VNIKYIRACLMLCGLVVVLQPFQGLAQQNSDAAKPSVQPAPAERDGQHDFDFELGTWKIHLKKLVHPLTGSKTWVEFDGTSVTRKVWGGRADLEEFETDSPVGGHIEGLTLRLYDPKTHQWNLYWATSKSGTIGPPTIGEFKDGRGEFYDTEPSGPNGRAILVRFIWSKTDTDSPHFEQSFSDDGGKTWEVNWITDQTRVNDEAVNGLARQSSTAPDANPQHTPTERDGQHDFDFEIGTWKTHLKRLLHPLTGSTTWVEYEGTSVVRKVWNGRANLLELEADGPGGHFEGLNLRLYNPQSHQWSLNFANSNGGTLSQPTIGEFKNGRGEFFDQESFNGSAILVRFVISDITPDSCRFEQAFSDDGGKTWEVNWIATDTRVKDEAVKAH
jgi:hypothetical protein